MESDLTELEAVVELARRAGVAVLDVYARSANGASVTWKDDRTPLTEADRASHHVITAGLAALTPTVPVISEEDASGDAERRSAGPALGPQQSVPGPAPAGGRHWLVDPLDGTKEFLKRTGEFTVNIALVEEGRAVAGVVHAPVLGKSWFGAAGQGAVLREGASERPLAVRTAPASRLAVVASRDHAGPRVQALFDRLDAFDVLSMGSSLKFCLIAEGQADLYLRDGPTMEWDTGAAQAVLEAAGGGVFTLEGVPLGYDKPELRNPWFVAVGDLELPWRDLISETEQDR